MVIQDPETAQIGEEILPFEMGYLPEFFKKKAELELNETPENKKTLLDFFPRAVLPVSYGGELVDYDQSAWLKRAMTPEELDKVGGGALRDLRT